VAELRALMIEKEIGMLPVTTGDGVLLGVVSREALDPTTSEAAVPDVTRREV
jgi:predicted transcriptional regulator